MVKYHVSPSKSIKIGGLPSVLELPLRGWMQATCFGGVGATNSEISRLFQVLIVVSIGLHLTHHFLQPLQANTEPRNYMKLVMFPGHAVGGTSFLEFDVSFQVSTRYHICHKYPEPMTLPDWIHLKQKYGMWDAHKSPTIGAPQLLAYIVFFVSFVLFKH